jgi:hypothetical protein
VRDSETCDIMARMMDEDEVRVQTTSDSCGCPSVRQDDVDDIIIIARLYQQQTRVVTTTTWHS